MAILIVVCALVVIGVVLYAHKKHLSVTNEVKAVVERIDTAGKK